MSCILDTNILIDQLRGLKPARDFTDALGDGVTISAISVTELYGGARSTEQKIKIARFVGSFRVLPFDMDTAELAGEYMRQYYKSHAVELPDAAIAATAQLHNLRLYTLNTKHFPMFKGLRRPY